MIRARIKNTRFGWRADVLDGGERILSSYHHNHPTAIEWACEKVRWYALHTTGGSHHEVP
jgi:hypothetical protein